MEQKPSHFECRKYKLELGRKTYVMGILNVTPDSFSDGGKYDLLETALKRAEEMVEEGADIIDVGGESTRPGHREVEAEEEIRRVVAVVEKLTQTVKVPISVDTSKAAVAEKSLLAGAHIINDVWGLQKDPQIAGVAARFGAGVVMMHNRDNTVYSDMMGEILAFLRESVHLADQAGIPSAGMCIDPGVGFGKTLEQNLEVMRRLGEFEVLHLPVLLGTSRKSMVGKVLDLPVDQRLEGSLATVSLGVTSGVDFVRVHDVKETVRTVRMTDAIVRGLFNEKS